METFSMETWTNLNTNEKHKHPLQNCKVCLRTFKYRELLAHQPVNLKNAKGKYDKNTSLLCPNIGYILQDRTNKIMASARKAVDINLKMNLMLLSNRHRLTSSEIKKRQLYKDKKQIGRWIKTNIEKNPGYLIQLIGESKFFLL